MPAPERSHTQSLMTALSVGDANFLSVSVNQSLVLSLFLVQHFSLLKLVSNISTSFFDFQEFLSELSHILTFYQNEAFSTYRFCVLSLISSCTVLNA